MDIFEQLEKAGLQVIAGKRSLKAALEVGKPAFAVGNHGACYRIISQNGQLAVDVIGKLESFAGVAIVRSVNQFILVR